MSKDWVQDISDMHKKFGVNDWVEDKISKSDQDSVKKLKKFLDFRLEFLKEELNETIAANKDERPDEVVDGLIDLCVVAIGTLNAFNVDPYKAWDVVHKANMTKEPGIKETRPNPLGLPDLIKPEGWEGPEHGTNIGVLPYAL